MTQYDEIKILEAKGLRELAQAMRNQPAEVITEDEYEQELLAELGVR